MHLRSSPRQRTDGSSAQLCLTRLGSARLGQSSGAGRCGAAHPHVWRGVAWRGMALSRIPWYLSDHRRRSDSVEIRYTRYIHRDRGNTKHAGRHEFSRLTLARTIDAYTYSWAPETPRAAGASVGGRSLQAAGPSIKETEPSGLGTVVIANLPEAVIWERSKKLTFHYMSFFGYVGWRGDNELTLSPR